jgi:Family of unknown function (DUF5670)
MSLAGANTRRPAANKKKRKGNYMLYTIAVILIIMWLLGMVTGTTISGFIHILLVIAIIMILINLISGRRRVL